MTQVGGAWARTGLTAATASVAVYNAANQLLGWNGTTFSPGPDANGNLQNDGTNTYTWNARNQLASISGGLSASFRYDAFGRRTRRVVNGTTTDFAYDGLNPIQELIGTNPPANILAGLGVDECFTRTDTAGRRSVLTDTLGSTVALTDDTGAAQGYTYEPFGKTTVSPANGNTFQFTGRENDGTGAFGTYSFGGRK